MSLASTVNYSMTKMGNLPAKETMDLALVQLEKNHRLCACQDIDEWEQKVNGQ